MSSLNLPQVSIFADPSNKVLKGTKSETFHKDDDSSAFLKNKIFIGNGTSNLSRDDVFKKGENSMTNEIGDNANRFALILLNN